MRFKDRIDAAKKLVARLRDVESPLVLAIPRGAVPMAAVIAEDLRGDLDVALVHKFGFPDNPEFALGSVDEHGAIHLGIGAERYGLDLDAVRGFAAPEIERLRLRRHEYTPLRASLDMRGRNIVIVDDGIATGATAVAAVRAARAAGAARIIVATPVAASMAVSLIEREEAEVRALLIPFQFSSVSEFYDDFSQVSDLEVSDHLLGETQIGRLKAFVTLPAHPRGVVIFAHGSNSGRRSPRNQFVATRLVQAGFVTVLADLLTEEESGDRQKVFDLSLLATRLIGLARWSRSRYGGLPICYFGASTGGGAALQAAAIDPLGVAAVVSRGGRPDLARDFLPSVKAPVLLIVGGLDSDVLRANREAFALLEREKSFEVIDGATHLFEEAGALEAVAVLAADWFERFTASSATSPARSAAEAGES